MEQESAPGLSVVATRESHRKNDDIKDLVVPNVSAKKAECVLQPFLPQLSDLKTHAKVRGHTCNPPPPSSMPCLTPRSSGPSKSAATIETTHRRTASGRGLWLELETCGYAVAKQPWTAPETLSGAWLPRRPLGRGRRSYSDEGS